MTFTEPVRDLALKGYQVTVFEKLPVAGGMLRVSIPAYRLPKDVVQKEVDQIASLGVEVRVNQALGKDFTIDSLQKDGFKAVFVALGTHKALQLQIPGEKDFPQVLDCIAFLRDVNLDKKPDYAGKKVVVVGDGNAAIDSARTSLRLGAEVVSAYRRTIPEMPANSWEIEEAEIEGVKIHTLVAPVKVLGTQSDSLGAIMQNFKSVSTRKINEMNKTPGISLWQRNYYDHIIRNEKASNVIRRYIVYNPLMWSYDMDNPGRHCLSTEEMKGEIKRRCGFTDEELDFVIDYETKYRVGRQMDVKT